MRQKAKAIEIIQKFNAQLEEASRKVWAEDYSNKNTVSLLVKEVEEIGAAIIKIGEETKEGIVPEPSVGDFLNFWIHFEWAEKAKSLLLLWRDIIFEIQRAEILLSDNDLEAVELLTLKERSKQVLLAAATDFKNDFEQLTQNETARNQKIEIWKHQFIPWKYYKEQAEKIMEQCQDIQNNHQQLLGTTKGVVQIRTLVSDTIDSAEKEIDEMAKMLSGALAFVEDESNLTKSRLTTHLSQIEEHLLPVQHITLFNDELDALLAELTADRLKIPVALADGLLQYKEVQFPRSIRAWIESEVLPILYEIWEQTEKMANAMKMALANIKNRIVLLSNEEKETPAAFQNICQPFSALQNQTEDLTSELQSLENLIDQRVARDFQMVNLYRNQDYFLPVPLQSTINQFRLNQNSWLSNIWKWWKGKWLTIQNFINAVETEETLSMSEKIVRFVENRTAKANHYQYANIFLTQGYIGESFWVGRHHKIAQLEAQIKHWKEGFRGASIISGQRFSGKSLVGELVINRHFHNKVVRLSPNTTIQFQGRRFEVKYKLEEALDFIQKHSLHDKQAVWIDDIELWRDSSVTLGENIRTLIKYIDNYSRRIFFLVSMNNWLRQHLQQHYGIERAFQAVIQMDAMSDAEIREAILIRHGATHKTLVDANGQEISPQQFSKMAAVVCRLANGNIGDALYLWTLFTEKKNEEEIIFKAINNYHLPENLPTDAALLLSTILMEKKTNEYRLRKLFGPAFKATYSDVLKRLIGVGLLSRSIDGWLQINPVAANETGRILAQKKYLQ